jgi:hypothetical protein
VTTDGALLADGVINRVHGDVHAPMVGHRDTREEEDRLPLVTVGPTPASLWGDSVLNVSTGAVCGLLDHIDKPIGVRIGSVPGLVHAVAPRPTNRQRTSGCDRATPERMAP